MLFHLANWVFTQKALAVMLMVALSIHAMQGTGNTSSAGVNGRAVKYGLAMQGGPVAAAAAATASLQIYIQAKPEFSPTRPAIVGHGDLITYTLVITNSGSLTQTQLVLTDVVPLGSTAITNTAAPSPSKAPLNGIGSWVWQITELSPGNTYTVSHAVRVNALVTVTAIVNVAQIRSDQTAPMNSNITVHVFGVPPDPPAESWGYYLPVVTKVAN